MPCLVNSNISICRPTLDGWERHFVVCFNCKRKRLVLCEFQGWYGWSTTCLTCGDAWRDGEVMPRPFARGWRKERVVAAKKRMKSYLDAAIPQGLADFMRRLEAGLA